MLCCCLTGLMQLVTFVCRQCQIPDGLWQHIRLLLFASLICQIKKSSLSICQVVLHVLGLKKVQKLLCNQDFYNNVFWPFSCCFCSSVGKENKSSCFFTWNYHKFKWISYWTVPNGKKEIILSTFAEEAVTELIAQMRSGFRCLAKNSFASVTWFYWRISANVLLEYLKFL